MSQDERINKALPKAVRSEDDPTQAEFERVMIETGRQQARTSQSHRMPALGGGMTTFCEECDCVTAETRKQHPGRWTCIKFPRLEGFSPVAPTKWVDLEPYMRCVGINGGRCPMFTAQRNGQQPLALNKERTDS